MVTVSVLMPVFNGEKYLAAAVESILAQTFRDFEFIVIDDGSKDGSLRILQEFQKREPRMRIISRDNRGVARTFNELLSYAQGEYVALNAQDDIALPERLALQVAFLRARPRVVCAGGSFELIDADDRYLTLLRPVQTDEEIQRLALAGSGSINASSAMIRRESALSVGGCNHEFYPAEDLDFWLRLGEIGELANLHEPLVRYRLHSASISEQNRSQQRAAARRACESAWQRRGIQGKFEAAFDWRPGPDRESRHTFMLQYGWWAFNSSQRQTALIYGWRAIQARPFRSDGWRLLLCALLKPLGAAR
jgi:glycosyltransferase involved in cell wall biosynthesis